MAENGFNISLEKAVEEFDDLPINPELLPKLQALVQDEDSILIDIASLIKVDASLTAKLIRLCNSAYYSGGMGAVKSLEDAIGRLGVVQVYELVSMEVSRRFMNQEALDCYGLKSEDLWYCSMACAHCMESLAFNWGYSKDTAYTIGILGEIGKSLISKYAKNVLPGSPYDGEVLTPKLEKEIFGFTYADAGAEILKKWECPEDIWLPIQCHLNSLEKKAEAPLATLLSLSISVSRKLLKPVSGQNEWGTELKLVEDFGKSSEGFLNAIKVTQEKMSEVKDLLGAF